jgi:K+-sensing histidine kinase KdpD
MGIAQAEHRTSSSRRFYGRAPKLGNQEGMGAGLGLFIAEVLVSAMGGRLLRRVLGRGEGSSFAFELPLARAEASA